MYDTKFTLIEKLVDKNGKTFSAPIRMVKIEQEDNVVYIPLSDIEQSLANQIKAAGFVIDQIF